MIPAPAAVELPTQGVDRPSARPLEGVLGEEWLVTNGLGGYAFGTVPLCNTRKYHGLFIPSLQGHGRVLMLARMDEEVELAGWTARLDGFETERGLSCPGHARLEGFSLHGLVPVWRFALQGATLERRVVLVHGENTLYVTYTHQGGEPIRLRLRPYCCFRRVEGELCRGDAAPSLHIVEGRVELQASAAAPPLRMRLHSEADAPFTALDVRLGPLVYRLDRDRGYEFLETLRSPGYFDCELGPGQVAAVSATTGGWGLLERSPAAVLRLEESRERHLLERAPEEARHGTAARLVLAADQFIIEPANRPGDEAWARASGQDVRSVIAGYPWFTDWGRDTMISLEGLTLATGRCREAGAILRTFEQYISDGLIPNYFPDGQNQAVYHTADATLWYFHALARFLECTSDYALLRDLFPALESIIGHHVAGTRFNIHVGQDDGLLVQGMEGCQLTWMDAKVDGWVVTPRRGKAVEINALFYNALCLMADWAPLMRAEASPYAALAERARRSFNARFWNPQEGCLFDVVDTELGGNDGAVRPNQIFSISLQHPILDRGKWRPVLEKVRDVLLTPVGLRTLSPQSPGYKARYDGDLRARDAAYHQGTVWPWLLGHFVDAWLKVSSDKSIGRGLLLGLERHLSDSCIGQLNEIFDASEPYRPRGCAAQAWSVAEVLRVWLKTAERR